MGILSKVVAKWHLILEVDLGDLVDSCATLYFNVIPLRAISFRKCVHVHGTFLDCPVPLTP
jgi:hypothetical protein